ncbi:MAG: sulfate ABC transporter ATP-binding protein [Bacteroidetes bacterium HGW-Bacteroidetes-2]|jgi:putrescine transport system ATP-binding protein|nr:MAG: sulfate ABC transporter ATP-binding protein [Bacteroidetes bacterium HGW-Bacteroidetes-2]
MSQFLTIQHLYKTFGKETVLQDINLTLDKNTVLSLLGSSGSGKTTLLKIIAGIETADKGNIFLEGNNISDQKPQERHIVYLYQEALLFPHLNAFENIAFGLRLQKMNESLITEKVHLMLKNIEMTKHAKKMPPQLSGGQKQRISFGRAMIIEPKLLLLDEPFGALDASTRSKMQELFKTLAHNMNLSALFVTHDLKEAIVMGDQIGKIQKGQLVQYETKNEFFNDAFSGVQKEIDFWKSIGQNT